MAKSILFAMALALALVHALVLSPRPRRAREAVLASPGDSAAESALRRTAAASGIVQTVVLALTLAILVLAADLVAS